MANTTQDLEKICNTAGTPIYKWAKDQLKTRSDKASSSQRSDSDVLYLGNKGAWIRVVSSVNLEGKTFDYFKDKLQGMTSDRSLAENFILYGGTSTYAFRSQQMVGAFDSSTMTLDTYEGGDLVGSKTEGMNMRSGLGAYNIAGNQEIKDFGYKPMPGITSINIESTGRMGSLRQATINFKVWDKDQLDIMDALYFRPGFTLAIEWGHAKYYDNDGNLQSSEQYMINPFKGGLSKEDIQIQMNTNAQRSCGNYGGMLGMIVHFDFSMTQDGGYDCTVKAMSLGALMGSFPINHTNVLPDAYYEQLTQYLSTQRSQELTKALAEAELKKADDEAKALTELNSSVDLWAKILYEDKSYMDSPLNGDPIATLIYNSGELGNDLYSRLPAMTITQTSTIGLNQMSYDLTKVREKVSEFKGAHDISDYRSDFQLNQLGKNYLINSEKYGPIISYNDSNGLFYIRENNNIRVTLDVNKLNRIVVSENVPNIKLVSKKDNSQGEVLYFDRMVNGGYTIGSGFSSYVTYSDGVNTYNVTAVYPVSTSNPVSDIQKAKSIFCDKNTVYVVKSIKSKNKTVQIEMTVLDEPNYSIILGSTVSEKPDLSLVSFVKIKDQDQSLMTNSVFTQYQTAVSNANEAYKNYLDSQTKEINTQFNDDLLKKTIQGESTIELMLRALMVYTFNNSGAASKKKNDRFFRSLFSEGAYRKIFANGIPDTRYYSNDDLKKYVNGQMTQEERLQMNFWYGNNYALLSCENVLDQNGNVKTDFIQTSATSKVGIPVVNVHELFNLLVVPYGESSELESAARPVAGSVYMNLGLFFMMLNHTGILYSKENVGSMERGETLVPMTYIDFNPSTNYYLSSANQFSIDPYKFLVRFSSDSKQYQSLFKDFKVSNGKLLYKSKEYVEGKDVPEEVSKTVDLFNPSDDRVSKNLPDTKIGLSRLPNAYIGRLMNVQVDINYLIKVMGDLRRGSDSNEAYFQSVIERIIFDLNKCMGGYNAFRLSYNDLSNCHVITDDQVQQKPQGTTHSEIIKDPSVCEIPVYGRGSIARSFEVRTDMSSRIASMLAISANPGTENQVATSKNTTDFGVYNTGSYDRFAKMKVDGTYRDGQDDNSNPQAAEMAANFNSVVKRIYTMQTNPGDQNKTQNISQDDIDRALSFYIDRMARAKNRDKETAHAMIIPLKTSMTMDGMSGLYPFQLFTVNERVLPYRYSISSLSNRQVAFSIARVSHHFEGSQWTTSLEGFMTLLRETAGGGALTSVPQSRPNEAGVINVQSYSNIVFSDSVKSDVPNINPALLANINAAATTAGVTVTITTAITGHSETTVTGQESRHVKGNAVDISIINGVAVSTPIGKGFAEKFVQALVDLGYVKNKESGNDTAVLYGIPDHTDHVHVSNKR